MREHENINARYIQYMYTFVYKWCSLFSHLTVYVGSLKDATLKKKILETNSCQRKNSAGQSITIILTVKENMMKHIFILNL